MKKKSSSKSKKKMYRHYSATIKRKNVKPRTIRVPTGKGTLTIKMKNK